MASSEDQLPPKQRLPRTFRTCVGNDTKARSHCPINGARPFNLVKVRDPRELDHEKKRKVQAEVRRAEAGIEHQAAGLGVQGTGGIEKHLSRDTHRTIAHSLTIIPQAECFHSWSIHDPLATTLPVDHHFATAPTLARTVPRQPTFPLSASSNVKGQHVSEHNFTQFQPPDSLATAPSLSPRPTYISHNAFPARSAATSPDLETSYNPSKGPSTSSPTIKFEDSQGSAAMPSPHVTPNHNLAPPAGQGSIWSEDNFIAAYQAFFLPHPIKDSSRLIYHDLDGTRAQQANGGPALEDCATKPACTDTTTATITYVSQTWLGNGDLVDWTLRLMPIVPIYPQQSEALKIAATAGYAHTLRLQHSLISSGLPEEAYAGMHASPPKIQSSYSELAHASVCSPYPSARAPATSSMRGPVTTLGPVVFTAQSSMSLNTPSTSWVSSDHHSCANSMTVLDNEDERSRFDAGNRTCSEIELLELSLAAFFDARQAYNTSQQLHDTT